MFFIISFRLLLLDIVCILFLILAVICQSDAHQIAFQHNQFINPLTQNSQIDHAPIRIAVIGAGAGGASYVNAFFLVHNKQYRFISYENSFKIDFKIKIWILILQYMIEMIELEDEHEPRQ